MKVQVKKRAEHESFIDIFFHVTWHDRSNVFMWNSTANAMINVGRYVLWKKVRLVFLDRPFPIFRRSTILSLWITLISTTFRIWNVLTKKKLDLYRSPKLNICCPQLFIRFYHRSNSYKCYVYWESTVSK